MYINDDIPYLGPQCAAQPLPTPHRRSSDNRRRPSRRPRRALQVYGKWTRSDIVKCFIGTDKAWKKWVQWFSSSVSSYMCSDFYQVISVSMRHLTISVQVHFLNTCSARRALRGGRLWLPKWFRRVTGKGYTTRWSTRGCPTPKIPVISLANNWGSKNYHITISPQRICT